MGRTDSPSQHQTGSAGNRERRRRIWAWCGIGAAAVTVTLAAGEYVLHRAGPILKGRVVETLSTRFDSRVELRSLSVSITRGIEVSGEGLNIYPPDEVVAAGATQPLIAVKRFRFHSGIWGLFIKPMHVRSVEVEEMQINVPPRDLRRKGSDNKRYKGKLKIDVNQIICEDSRLVLETSDPQKDPKNFELRKIVLQDVSSHASWKYDAFLRNAVPRGEIHSSGAFGPWDTESPGNSPVQGHYVFKQADLNTIKGIGGTLSSIGDFKGQLDNIVVDGSTETPNFSLDTANHPMLLQTQFHAVVDGTTGTTQLQSVRARLRNSTFTTSGEVISIKGRGHRIALQVDVRSGQLQDFLDLAVETTPPVMTSLISMNANLQIRPGRESVMQKLRVEGTFGLREIHFTNPKVQDKVDMLSLRAQGYPKKANPGAKDVDSQMTGEFQMANGAIQFRRLAYTMPGADVNLDGVYSLDGERFEFKGRVLTDASLSRMVDSPWASLLLKPISPFFRRKGGGASIPVSISGTRSEPKFGLDVLGRHSKQ